MIAAQLPEGYKVEELPGGCRQYFPGGFREFQKFRCGYVTTTSTDGRPIAHDELNEIFKDHCPYQEAKCWDETFPFENREKIAKLEKRLAIWKTIAKVGAAISAINIVIKGFNLIHE